MDGRAVKSLLKQHNLSTAVIDDLTRVYDANKAELRIKNLTTGHSLQHLTNVEWKLSCDIKSSELDSSSGDLGYSINLGRFKEKTGERESIADFCCNFEELQALVNKLKDIERHCQKLAGQK